MGIYLGQMPPAEMARLKAEIAETLIANFSYPRFYDYRTNTLRMRPVDRAKRQEVWTYLSSFDFNTFSRIDVTSPDFQRQVERLLIHFVQRNRAFFGQQGRKRMADVRALITSSSQSVAEGLRGHLSGRPTSQHAFGNARPVTSWSKVNSMGRLEPGWEQIVNSTMLLQRQLQEIRGETRPGVNGDTRPAAPPAMTGAANNGATAAPPRRSPRLRATTQGGSGNETDAPPAPASALPVPPVPSVVEPARPSAPVDQRVLRATTAEDAPAPSTVSPAPSQFPVSPPVDAQRELTRTEPQSQALSNQPGSAPLLVSDEDVVIFEQMRHQLIVWLRVEVVRVGVDLTGQSPAELLEILGQQDGADETRLQVVSTLLGLANQVIANGYATLVEYKQAMMFYLIHTRRAR